MAVTRKWVAIAYSMLKDNVPFRYAKPKLRAGKFTVLDRAAGIKTSRWRKRELGPTIQTRAGLAAVDANAERPKVTSPDELPDGERRMLQEQKLNSFVGELCEPASKRPSTKTSTK